MTKVADLLVDYFACYEECGRKATIYAEHEGRYMKVCKECFDRMRRPETHEQGRRCGLDERCNCD